MTCEHPGLRAGGEVSQMLFVEVWRVWQVENEGNWVAGWGGELDEPQWDDRVDVGCHSWSWRSQGEGLALGWGRGVQLWPSWVQVSGRGRLDGRDPAHLPVFLVPCLGPAWMSFLCIMASLPSDSGIKSSILPCPDGSLWFPVRLDDTVKGTSHLKWGKARVKAPCNHWSVLEPGTATGLQFPLLSRGVCSAVTPAERCTLTPHLKQDLPHRSLTLTLLIFLQACYCHLMFKRLCLLVYCVYVVLRL